MAQQKIRRSQLQKVMSSSTTSLVFPTQSYVTSKTFEVRVNPMISLPWQQQQLQPPPPQLQNHHQLYEQVYIERNPTGAFFKSPYRKHKLATRSLSDLRSFSFANLYKKVLKMRSYFLVMNH